MDFLKSLKAGLKKIPSGSLTVSSSGKIVSSTIPSWVPANFLSEVANCVISTFQNARENNFVLNEVVIKYSNTKIVAKEMRGGYFISLMSP